jgi:chromosome segregation ATPase
MRSTKGAVRPQLPVPQSQSIGGIKPEEVRRLQSDLDTLVARLGQPPRLPSDGSAAGSIVNELRTVVSDARGSVETLSTQSGSKLDMVEAVLAKVTELDRAILRETEPVTDGAVKRRNSKNGEISILPLHLQVVDRLIDLHTQSKRPVVIHTQVAQKPKPSPEEVSAIETMKAIHAHEKSELESRLSHLYAKCAEMEGRLTASHSEIAVLRKEKIDVEKTNAEITAQLSKLNEASAASSACVDNNLSASNAELNDLLRKYDELKTMCKVMEQQLDVEAEVRPKVLNAMIKLAGDLSNNSNTSIGSASSYFHGANNKVRHH